jgi:hypothetical protein
VGFVRQRCHFADQYIIAKRINNSESLDLPLARRAVWAVAMPSGRQPAPATALSVAPPAPAQKPERLPSSCCMTGEIEHGAKRITAMQGLVV